MRKHVVFVVDSSRSMDKEDVRDQDGDRIRRIDGVLDAVFEFIEDQLVSRYSCPEDRYSIISFNDVAKVQLRAKRMVGRNLFALQKDMEAKIIPTHGTSYGEGLSAAWDVARGALNDAGEQFVLIFLSDGRPRDMNATCKREQMPAYWLRTMRERFRRRFTFHGVGFGTDDFQLLEDLCDVAKGTFHRASLSSAMYTHSGKNAARAPTMSGHPNTLSNTFSQISSSVSTVCTSRRPMKMLPLEDVEEGEWNCTEERLYICDKLSLQGDRLVVVARDLETRMRARPFAEGGMRHCFRMWDFGARRSGCIMPRQLVAKQSKFRLSLPEQLINFRNDLRCHARARILAAIFNSKLERFAATPAANNITYSALKNAEMKVAECDVYRLEDDQEPGCFRYVLTEPFLDGKYVKYNGNNGYVSKQSGLDSDQRCWWQVAQAFSHFTFHITEGEQMVCDMQGVEMHMTDPAVHSRNQGFGEGDRGTKGMQAFLSAHRCNAICRFLRLPPPPPPEEEPAEDVSVFAHYGRDVRSGRPPPSAFAMAAQAVIYEEDEEDSDD